MTADPQSAETALSAARQWVAAHAVRWDKYPSGTTVVDAEELDRFLAALPASTESTGAMDDLYRAVDAMPWLDVTVEDGGGGGQMVAKHAVLDLITARLGAASGGVPAALDDWTLLAEAWANVMDGRRIGEGLNAARIGRETTTPDDWHAIAAEYHRLARSASEPAGSAHEIASLRRALDECRQHHADTLAGLDPHTGPASSEPEAPGLRLALLRIFDLAEARPDIRAVAHEALNEPAGTTNP